MQKFLNVSKKVLIFLFIVIVKLFESPKQKPIAELEKNKKRNKVGLIKLIKSIYNGVRNGITQNFKKQKEEVNRKQIKTKTTRKTWARVKQDFKEWYDTLIKEFYENQNSKLSEEIPENKEIQENKEIHESKEAQEKKELC